MECIGKRQPRTHHTRVSSCGRPEMRLQGPFDSEGHTTTLYVALIWPCPVMRPLMSAECSPIMKRLVASRLWATEWPLSSVCPSVCLEIPLLAEGLAASSPMRRVCCRCVRADESGVRQMSQTTCHSGRRWASRRDDFFGRGSSRVARRPSRILGAPCKGRSLVPSPHVHLQREGSGLPLATLVFAHKRLLSGMRSDVVHQIPAAKKSVASFPGDACRLQGIFAQARLKVNW